MPIVPKEWWTGLRRLASGPMSLERLLALIIAGSLLVAIAVLAVGAGGLLREQADEQALARVRLAGLAARDELRRYSEDALTSARLLAGRPTLRRLVRDGELAQLELFLRRFCETGGLDACAVIESGTTLASTGGAVDWSRAGEAAAEQGERFMVATTDSPTGNLGAMAQVESLPGVRVMVLRRFDETMAGLLAAQVGMQVRFVPLSTWLDTVAEEFRPLHTDALAGAQTVVAEIPARDLYASSTPVLATTGEGVALIEARLPAAEVATAVERFVRRLTLTSLLLAVLAVLAALALARQIGRPLQALAQSAERLGSGDFSTSIPATGTPEVAALARTMDEMRRNLIGLTGELRRREAEAQAVLHGVVEGVFAVDAGRAIRYLNPQAARMLGVASEEVIGRFCGDVLKPCTVDGKTPCEDACPILAARTMGRAQATESLENGAATRTVVITSSGAVDGLQVQVMRDETELEAVRRARDSVLANISHEFRTPLAAQLASIELMQDGLADMSREGLRELLDSLQRGTLRLTRLIDNLLESVRIESGQLGIRRQPVELPDIIEDAHGLIAGLLAQRGQSLLLELPADLPVIEGDAQRLAQVMTNLLANASKFGPEGTAIRVGGERRGAEVDVWVEDEGPGVPDLDHGSIFERFYRAADAEPEPRGLGLGLWIVKSIVERHAGRVGAGRTAAGRTRFTVTLPVGEAAP